MKFGTGAPSMIVAFNVSDVSNLASSVVGIDTGTIVAFAATTTVWLVAWE